MPTANGNHDREPKPPGEDEQSAAIEEAVDYLARFGFPHVQVFVSGENPEGDTYTFHRGHGNHNARIHMAQQYIDADRFRAAKWINEND